MWLIKVYRDKIIILLSTIGSFASVLSIIISLITSSEDIFGWKLGLIIATAILLILMVIAAVIVLKSDVPTRRYKFDDREGIRNYLFNWIKNGRRVVIWSRDMSWVDDEEMTQMLRGKAQADELILCLPKEIDKSDDLKKHGAEVFVYGTLGVPETRFTIANYGQVGSRVAIGRRRDSLHIIQEFSETDERPAFHMARDLVRLAQERENADP